VKQTKNNFSFSEHPLSTTAKPKRPEKHFGFAKDIPAAGELLPQTPNNRENDAGTALPKLISL